MRPFNPRHTVDSAMRELVAAWGAGVVFIPGGETMPTELGLAVARIAAKLAPLQASIRAAAERAHAELQPVIEHINRLAAEMTNPPGGGPMKLGTGTYFNAADMRDPDRCAFFHWLDTVRGLSDGEQLWAAWQAATAAERERCARAVESWDCACAMACQCPSLAAAILSGGAADAR